MFLSISYNKQEEDFESLREYNDYLEEVETISKYNRVSFGFKLNDLGNCFQKKCQNQFPQWIWTC